MKEERDSIMLAMEKRKIAPENHIRIWKTSTGAHKVSFVGESNSLDPVTPPSHSDVRLESLDGKRQREVNLQLLPLKLELGKHVYTDTDEWFLAWKDGEDWFYDARSSRWHNES